MTPAFMPDFARPHYGFRHSLRSALASLEALRVPDLRIQVAFAGPVAEEGAVVAQSPAAGSLLDENTTVRITIAGLGFFHHLPGGMRDWGGNEMGTREIVELFDDPLAKAGRVVSEGSRQFAIGPNQPDACARWMRLFGLDEGAWPQETWYGVSSLLPLLHRVAGTVEGIRLALSLVLALPLEAVRTRASFARLPESDLFRPGQSLHRLGVDTIAGNRVAEPPELVVVIGPVTLSVHGRFQSPDGERIIRQVLELAMPCDRRYAVQWSVLDRGKAPRLGDAEGNARLGVNSHLGAERT